MPRVLPRPSTPDNPVPDSPMKIGIIAPPWVTVPPTLYGGTELVIDHLARGLDVRGHDVTLFTTGDSTCPVKRQWLHERTFGTTADLMAELSHVEAAYAALADCDIIHDHTLLGLLWAGQTEIDARVVTTVHGQFTPALTALYASLGSRIGVIAISEHQRSTAPTVPVDAVIHHGIDLETFPMGEGDGGYVVFLGRMRPRQGSAPGHQRGSCCGQAHHHCSQDVGTGRTPLLPRGGRATARR